MALTTMALTTMALTTMALGNGLGGRPGGTAAAPFPLRSGAPGAGA